MPSKSGTFETVAEAQRLARRRLPPSVYRAVLSGAERGVTMADNLRAFGEIGMVPRIATGPLPAFDLGTTVLGQPLTMPVVISPVGIQAIHPEGELAVGRAAAAAGVAAGLSAFASRPIEEVLAVNPATFSQLYWIGGRPRMEQLLTRARAAGSKGIIVTLDWTFAHRRDWGTPFTPDTYDLRAVLRLGPEALLRPAWLSSFLRAGGLPKIAAPNLDPPDGPPPTFFGAYGEWMATPLPTWDDIAWLRETWGGPLLIKGVLSPDDARRAVAIGADAISVSNHGGNNVDGTPASIRLLPAVVDAVGDDIEVLLDGGVRRGSDIAKAVALGARAVLIGRAHLWGVAAGGEAGVARVLEILRAGLQETLAGLGHHAVGDLTPDDLMIPSGFSEGLAPRAVPTMGARPAG